MVVGYRMGRGLATGIRVPTGLVFKRFAEVDIGKTMKLNNIKKQVLAQLKGIADDAADDRSIGRPHWNPLPALHFDLLPIGLSYSGRIDNK